MPTDIVIAKIKKSSTSEVWVVAKEFAGRTVCDVREYFHPADSPDWLPTKKGVSIPPDHLAKAVDAANELSERTELGECRSIPRGDKTRLRFAICEYQKHVYGEVRTYYSTTGNGENWKPGKGVTLPLAALGQLAEALRLAEDQFDNLSLGN